MTADKKIVLLEEMINSDQLNLLRAGREEHQLTNEEYLDYLCCYFKEAHKRGIVNW